jgi:hypothetical protein
MKYYLMIPVLAIFILAGCAKENSIMGPLSPQKQSTVHWLKLTQSTSLSIENTFSVSESIDGNKGGSIELTQYFKNNGQIASVSANLTIPKGAFKGTEIISYTVNTEAAGIEFSPNTLNFTKSLSLDLTFTGLKISRYKASDLSFSYLDGSNIVPVTSNYVNVDTKKGLLVVLGAQISHFSRYGWSTIDDPRM